MPVDPTFSFVMSPACARFYRYHLALIVEMGPEKWDQDGRMEYSRIEDALDSLRGTGTRPALSRREANTLIALSQRSMAGGQEYDFRDLVYHGEEEDWKRQRIIYEEILMEAGQYPSSLPAIVRRLELMVGLRQTLPGQVQMQGLQSQYVQHQSRRTAS